MPAPVPESNQVSRISKINVLMDCITESKQPSVLEVLKLMDANEPMTNLKYADAHSELDYFGVKTISDVYTYPVELLATLGGLGRDGVHRLRRYTWEKVLEPLTRYQMVGDNDDSSEVEVVKTEVAAIGPSQRVAKQTTVSDHDIQSIRCTQKGKEREEIRRWIDSTIQGDALEGVDGLEFNADVESEGKSEDYEYEYVGSSSQEL
jgi:hypothetical protein